jgi:hypothetical protein
MLQLYDDQYMYYLCCTGHDVGKSPYLRFLRAYYVRYRRQYSCWNMRVHILRASRFWTTKVVKQIKEFYIRNVSLWIFFKNRNYGCQGLVMLSVNLLIILCFALCLVFLLLINEIDKNFCYVWHPYYMQRWFSFF